MSGTTQTTKKILTVKSKPFLKWAGGKSQLLKHLLPLVPSKFTKYIEPFVGGGALFFALEPRNSILGDSNEELIVTYREVRDDVELVIENLKKLTNDRDSFYRIRAQKISELSLSERASRMIYLNKTCFNGLYRVNKKGRFNTPYNGAVGSNFIQHDTLCASSKSLRNAAIEVGDYRSILYRYAEKDDFVFLDPPYQPVGKYSDFKRYTKEQFYIENQVELSKEFERLVNIGCKVILTNSSHEIIKELYKNYDQRLVDSKRLISSNAKTRIGNDLIILGGF